MKQAQTSGKRGQHEHEQPVNHDHAGRPLMERLAYSPDEVAESLGLSRELINDLIRTGELGSIKAGRRRVIGKHHIAAFLGIEKA